MAVIAGIGMTMLLITGEVDLSIGSLAAFVGVVTMDIVNKTQSTALGVLAGLALGALTGLANGLVRTKLKVNSLIGTIAMMMILRGGVYIYRIAAVQNYHQKQSFFISATAIWLSAIDPADGRAVHGVLLIINKSLPGRYLYATGATRPPASGIGVDRLKIRPSS
jgi:ribose transport system permease protein